MDLLEYQKDAENGRRETKTAAAASSCTREQFEYHEELKKKAKADGAAPLFCCFALHPHLSEDINYSYTSEIELLFSLAAEGRLDAVGETGFDLYNESFKAGEKIQDEMFAYHLEISIRYGLPMIIHVRRAMHKIFPFTASLKKLPAVIFHSWPGTKEEAEALLKKGINTYFSFGSVVLKNHRKAMSSAAHLPAERMLLETDAPYQPLYGNDFSSWRDLAVICRGIAALRKEAGSFCNTPLELEELTTENFFRVFAK
jgi:TatD DNase family protein